MALDDHLAELPEFHELATVYDEVLGERINRYYYLPKNGDDLLKQFELIVASTRMGDGFIPFRRDVKYLECVDLPIQPLIPALTFIENKTSWGNFFRLGFFEIPKADFDLMAGRMVEKTID